MDIYFVSDFVGLIGVFLVVSSFFLLQAEKFTPSSWGYLLFNLFGALMLLFSLCHTWNLASVIIECLWLSITTYEIIKFKILRKK
ncbi:MAG: hypothetical protein K2P31_03655 [Rickettsiaceae bacterium]|nr:hypothetical protein [Rickettsiaceae bacterium]